MNSSEARLFHQQKIDKTTGMSDEVELHDLSKENQTIFSDYGNTSKPFSQSAIDFLENLRSNNLEVAGYAFAQADATLRFEMLKTLVFNHVYNAVEINNDHVLRAEINQFIENSFRINAAKFKSTASDIFSITLYDLNIVQWLAILNEAEKIDELFTRFPQEVDAQVNFMSTTKANLMISPLHIAADYGHEEAASCLLKYHADPFIRTSKGTKPIAVAANRGHYHIVKLFHTDPEFLKARCKYGYTIAHYAAYGGNLEIIKYLHSLKVSMVECSSKQISPLMIALSYGHDEISSFLYKNNASGNLKDHAGKSPLHYACSSNKLSTLKLALEHNRDLLDTPNELGATPFYFAIANSFTDGALFLLEQGCDFQKASIYHAEPLHLAASFNNLVVVKALLKRGVDYKKKITILREQLDEFITKNKIMKKFLDAMKGVNSIQISAEEIADIYGAKQVADFLKSKRIVDEHVNSFTVMDF